MSEIEEKKNFLYEGSLLFDRLISLAPDDTIRRYLAFRIIVNTMSFEDLIGQRRHPNIREIRNVLLAHKQEDEFFKGYNATDEIRNATIGPLILFMQGHLANTCKDLSFPELSDSEVKNDFEAVSKAVMKKFFDDEFSGFRVTNNFLTFTGNAIHEISSSDLSGCFFRYSSSMSLMNLAMYFVNNLYENNKFVTATRLMKLELILHAQNMTDCVFKDTRNRHSINGLLEILTSEQIGNTEALENLMANSDFNRQYSEIRNIRNKLIGHMDRSATLDNLFNQLDSISLTDIYDMYNNIDKAINMTAKSHPAIWGRYAMINARLKDENIVSINGMKATSYY